jgi:hypothetical protein
LEIKQHLDVKFGAVYAEIAIVRRSYSQKCPTRRSRK